jgi:hypothetical protein
MLNRSRERNRSPCGEYKDDNDCNQNYNCYFDYDEKECRRKGSPERMRFKDILEPWNSPKQLPTDLINMIDSFENKTTLIDLYPMYPDEILERLRLTGRNRIKEREVAEFLNYLPELPEDHWFLQELLRIPFNDTVLGLSGNEQFVHLIENKNWGMLGAARGGHLDIVKFLVRKGANDWNWGMARAAQGGHLDIVEFFISKGARGWNRGMAGAARGGHLDIVKFFISKGANNWDEGMVEAARGGHLDIIDFFIGKGANNWELGMQLAAYGGHLDIVKFLVSKGANDWNGGMEEAARGGHLDIVKFFISKGADDWDWGMEAAVEDGHQDIIDFFREQLRRREGARRIFWE